FAIGIFQRGLDLSGALQAYTLLTVGEGLVTQIPALLISAASGLIVTRHGTQAAGDGTGEANLGGELMSQFLAQPQAILIAAGVLATLSLAPGLPKLPF